jgi:hypothetical protein
MLKKMQKSGLGEFVLTRISLAGPYKCKKNVTIFLLVGWAFPSFPTNSVVSVCK